MIRADAVDDTSVRGRLDAFVETTGRKLLDELRLTARVIARSLATSTQPYGLTRAALQTGRAAVARDIGRVFTTPSGFYSRLEDEDPAAAARFWQAWKARDLSAVEQIVSKSRAGSGMQIMVRPDAAHHQRRRGPGGRVGKKSPTAMVLDRDALAEYRRTIQNRVGLTKAGWAGAAEDAGAGGGFPAWAGNRHTPMRGHATVSDDPRRPEIVLHNDVEWAREALPESEEQAAVDIAEDRLVQRLEIILVAESDDPF